MRRFLFGILILTVTLLSSCAQSYILEENGIMSIYGVDITEREQFRTTSVFYKFGSESQESSKIVKGEGKTLGEGQKQMNYKLGFDLQSGAIELEVFGKETAKRGLMGHIEAAIRDPEASNRRLLSLSDTTAEDLITKMDELPKSDVNRALQDNIDKNSDKNIIPKVTLHSFHHHYSDAGRDPIMPIISYQNKKAKLIALGLFQGDKLVDKVPIDKAFYINMADKNISGVHQEVQLPLKPFKDHLQKDLNGDRDEFYTVFNIEQGASDIKLVDEQNLHFQTRLNFEVEILELTERVNLQKQAVINTMEAEIEQAIKQEYTELLTNLQKRNVDPMGYGHIYNAQKRNDTLTDSEWRDKFPNITVDVDVDVELLDQGVTP